LDTSIQIACGVENSDAKTSRMMMWEHECQYSCEGCCYTSRRLPQMEDVCPRSWRVTVQDQCVL